MGYLVQDTASPIIVIIRTSGRIFWETPESVVWAGNNGVGAGHSIEQRTSVSAVTVLVSAVDCWRCSLDTLDRVVDGADLGLLGSRLEPDGKVVGGASGCGVGSAGHGDSIRNTGLERASLRAAT